MEELVKICKVNGLKHLKTKNVMAMQVVLELILESGNYLNNDWKILLQVVSNCEFMLNCKKEQDEIGSY